MNKRFISLLLTLTMLFLCIPGGIFAEGEDEPVVEEVIVETEAQEEEPVAEEPAPEPAPEPVQEEEPAPAAEVVEEETEETDQIPEDNNEGAKPDAEEEESHDDDVTEEATSVEPEPEAVTDETPVTEEPATEELTSEEPASEETTSEEPATVEVQLFEYDGDTLIKYNGSDEEVTLEDGVRIIGKEAFAGNKSLRIITLPDSVEAIKDSAFADCPNLEKVILGEQSKLSSIGEAAFKNDMKLDASFAEGLEDVAENAFGITVEVEEVPEDEPKQDTTDTTTEEPAVEEPAEVENEAEEPIIVAPEIDEIIIEEPEIEEPTVEEVVIEEVIDDVSEEEDELLTVEDNVGLLLTGLAEEESDEEDTGSEEDEIVDVTEGILLEGTAAVGITKQPVDIPADIGEYGTFTVEAENAASYQWYYTKDNGANWLLITASSAKTAEYRVKATANHFNVPYLVRCTVTGTNGDTVDSEIVRFVEKTEPATVQITKQPENIPAAIGEYGTFTVEAENAASYQWYYTKDNGANWLLITASSAKTAEYRVKATANHFNVPYLVRCTVTGTNGDTVDSEIVRFVEKTETATVKITKQPENIPADIGEYGTFTVEAENAASYQWYYTKNNGASWLLITASSAKTAEYRVKATANHFDVPYLVRCTVTGTNGDTVDSEIVRFVEKTEPATVKITKQPENIPADIGEYGTFTVEAENAASYQWYYTKNNGSSWLLITASSAKTAEYRVKATANHFNVPYLVRCTVTGANGDTVDSEIVRFVEKTAPAPVRITKEPENIPADIGEYGTFTVEAENAASYQWYYTKDNGASWLLITASSAKTAEYRVKATANHFNVPYLVRCTVTGTNGDTVDSEIVRFVEKTATNVKITKQPENIEAAIGEYGTFTVEAENAASYQWYYSKDNGENWLIITASSAKTAEYRVKATANHFNVPYLVRCTVTGINGDTEDSEIVRFVTGEIIVDQVTYEKITDTTVAAIAYAGTESALTIPTTFEFGGATYTVTEIGEEAFMGKSFLVSIDLPNTITIIHARAFKNCTNLSTMTNHD